MSLPPPFRAWGEHIAIDLPGARAVFTTRAGGCSRRPYASLNIGRFTGDEPEAVERNRAWLADQLGVRLAEIRQVHGAVVRRIAEETSVPEAGSRPTRSPPEADGQATALPGIAPMVLVADCLPIALAGEGAVAMLHAGWRGLAAGIVSEGVRAMRELGAHGPLTAAIGPGAGVCCYEVGESVHAAFAGAGARGSVSENLDLKAIARGQLGAAGVEKVHDVGICTICSERSMFFSHRRDRGETGRQAGVAWLT